MIEVYCDESRPEVIYGDNSQDRYMIIGGIWVPYSTREDVKNDIKFLKKQHNVHGEFKWKTVSPSKIGFYRDLIDLFFSTGSLRFRCIVVDSWTVDMDMYHQSDSELGFYKFYYQLLKHWVDSREDYWIYLDYKKNKMPDRLHTLKSVLSNTTSGRINAVQAIESKQSLLIQLADVLIGAVGYKYHQLCGSDAKLEIVERIEYGIGHRIRKTYRSAHKFNIFEIDLR